MLDKSSKHSESPRHISDSGEEDDMPNLLFDMKRASNIPEDQDQDLNLNLVKKAANAH